MPYTPYTPPDLSGLMSFLTPEDQGRFGQSGGNIAKSFGYDSGKYGDYFQKFDMSNINKTLGQLPEMQSFMYNQNRQGYNNNMQGLLGKVGQTGLASTGSFKNDFKSVNNQFENSMFGSDKSIQDIIAKLRGQLSDASSGWYNQQNQLLQSGAKKGSRHPRWDSTDNWELNGFDPVYWDDTVDDDDNEVPPDNGGLK